MICPEVGERVQPLWRAHAAVARQGPDGPQAGGGTALEATQGQIDGVFSQLPYKCHQNRVASVGV